MTSHSAPTQPRRWLRHTAAAAVGLALVGGGILAGTSIASASSSDPNYHVSQTGAFVCLNRDGSSTIWAGKMFLMTSAHPISSCPKGYSPLIFDRNTVTNIAAPPTTLKKVGGPWSPGHTVLSSAQLPAGTYLITVTGDFYRAGDPADCQALGATPVGQIQVNGLITQQVTAYTGAFPADPNETCGVDADGHPNGLEQTASATAIATVPDGGGRVELDAFAYNPDRSSSATNYFGVIAQAQFELIG